MAVKTNKGGRPTLKDKDTVRKLEEAFTIGCTAVEACRYANIGRSTFYGWMKDEGFSDKMEVRKMAPVLKAKRTIYMHLDQIAVAKWWLERRRRQEYSLRSILRQEIDFDDELNDELFAEMDRSFEKTMSMNYAGRQRKN